MPEDITEQRIGVTGSLLIADVGVVAPDDTATPWGAGWFNVGLLSDEGPSIQPSMEKKDFKSWQRFFPTRTQVTDRGMEWKFTVQQRNGVTLKLAFGGGEITDLGGGDFLYEPAATQDLDFHAFGLEVLDGDIIDRYVLDRGLVTGIAAIPFRKDELVKFDLTVQALAPADADDLPWKIISNDPSFADGIVS